MPTPPLGQVQLLDPDGLQAWATWSPSDDVNLRYTGRWVVHLPAIPAPGGDGLINEVDFTVPIPSIPGFYLQGWIGNDSDGDPARFAAAQVLDSASLPAWVTYHGTWTGSPTDLFWPLSVITYDGGFSVFDAGVGSIVVDGANSDPDWHWSADATISGIAPTSGNAGDALVITGTGFVYPQQVTVGATAGFTLDSPTQITAVVPGTTAGAHDVLVEVGLDGTVRAGAAWARSPTQFTLLGAPVPDIITLVGDSRPQIPPWGDSTTHELFMTIPVPDVTLGPIVADGDLMVVGAIQDHAGTPAVPGDPLIIPAFRWPPGWTVLASETARELAYKIWHTGDPVSYDIGIDGPGVCVMAVFRHARDVGGSDASAQPGSASVSGAHFTVGGPFADPGKQTLYVAVSSAFGNFGDTAGFVDAPLLAPALASAALSTWAAPTWFPYSDAGNRWLDGMEIKLGHYVEWADGDQGPYSFHRSFTDANDEAVVMSALFLSFVDAQPYLRHVQRDDRLRHVQVSSRQRSIRHGPNSYR